MTSKKEKFIICVIFAVLIILSINFYLWATTPPKVEMLGPTTPQKCQSNMVWDSDYYGGNRGGACRHIYYMNSIMVPIHKTETKIATIEGTIVQVQKNVGDGYIITLQSGDSYNLPSTSYGIRINSVIDLDMMKHDYGDCITNATRIENGTWYYGQKAYDLTEGEHNVFYYGGESGFDRSACDAAKFTDYKESSK